MERKPRKKLGLSSGSGEFASWVVGSDYSCERLLGTGSYGKVALAMKKSTG
jgi:hypothetical protein